MEKPAPKVTADSRVFWDGCNRHEFLFQRCKACGQSQYYPRYLCRDCQSTDLEWEKALGTGIIFSVTMVRRPTSPAFQADAPYAIALIDLDNGPRVMTNIVGRGAENAEIGARVKVTFEARGEQNIPQFELA